MHSERIRGGGLWGACIVVNLSLSRFLLLGPGKHTASPALFFNPLTLSVSCEVGGWRKSAGGVRNVNEGGRRFVEGRGVFCSRCEDGELRRRFVEGCVFVRDVKMEIGHTYCERPCGLSPACEFPCLESYRCSLIGEFGWRFVLR